MDDEERAREEREQVVNPNRFTEPTVENGGLWARCPACMGNIKDCGDCGGWLFMIEPKPDLICICTEPPSDGARRAGMSWGGVSATISGACPLCQDGCPPECRSLKPYGYDDAPQWQKDAWDSDTNKLMQMAADALKEPSSGGWAMPSEVVYGFPFTPMEFPQVTAKRGGIRHGRFVVSTHVYSRKPHWWRRRTWHLRVQMWNGEEHVTAVLDLDNKARAEAAELMIKLCVKSINENYFKEMDDRAR